MKQFKLILIILFLYLFIKLYLAVIFKWIKFYIKIKRFISKSIRIISISSLNCAQAKAISVLSCTAWQLIWSISAPVICVYFKTVVYFQFWLFDDLSESPESNVNFSIYGTKKKTSFKENENKLKKLKIVIFLCERGVKKLI